MATEAVIHEYAHTYDDLALLRANDDHPDRQIVFVVTNGTDGKVTDVDLAVYDVLSNDNTSAAIKPNNISSSALGRYFLKKLSAGSSAGTVIGITWAQFVTAYDAGSLLPYNTYNISDRGIQVMIFSTLNGKNYGYNRGSAYADTWKNITAAQRAEVRDKFASSERKADLVILDGVGGTTGVAVIDGFGVVSKSRPLPRIVSGSTRPAGLNPGDIWIKPA